MKTLHALAITAAPCPLLTLPAEGQFSFTTLQDFPTTYPVSLVSANGALFGALGGTNSMGYACGGVFELQPPATAGGEWVETLLYSFAFPDPCILAFRPVVTSGGTIYGLAQGGGAYGEGALYKLESSEGAGGVWNATVLYSFGSPPGSDLIAGPGGSFYVLVLAGGAYGWGALVQMQPASAGGAWTATDLYSFPPGTLADSLVGGPGGVFYGTAEPYGKQFGQVFQLTPPSSPGATWTSAVLYTFPEGRGKTGNPNTLTLAEDGEIYGTAYGQNPSGTGAGHGGVFRLAPPSSPGEDWRYALLKDFGTRHPNVPLVLHGSNLYGVLAPPLASSSGGEVFELQRPTTPGSEWTTTVLYSFDDGQSPISTLIAQPGGTLYGTSVDFGANPVTGTVYSLTPQ